MNTATRMISRLLTVTCLLVLARGAQADEKKIGYRHDVLPILSDRCFKCHGPDSASRKAGLRLDRPDTATAGLDSGGKAIVPGKSDESQLVKRTMSKAPHQMMAPPGSGTVPSDS